MLPTARDRFEQWLRTPVPTDSSHPRVEFRLARDAEFERIYDLVDEAFGVARPRALYDWLYRRNPLGRARCLVGIDKRSGRIVCSGAQLPWPIARGGEALCGVLIGDLVVAPGFQRLGLDELRQRIQERNPLHTSETWIGWPNGKSVRRTWKYGRDAELLGPLCEGVFPLGSAARRLARGGLRLLAAAGSCLPGASLLGRGGSGGRGLVVEGVGRFDSGFDGATERGMSWEGFWSPHDAGFLNWRYLDRPVGAHRALAVLEGEEVAGYCVVRSDGDTALLMEFAAPEFGAVRSVLLGGALGAAREAGCRRLAFHAPPGWRHWSLFRAAGLVDRDPQHVLAADTSSPLGAGRLEDWQLVPGDGDAS